MSKYACADINGHCDIYEQIMDNLREQDRLYILGNAISNSAGSYDMLCDMLRNTKIHFILGVKEVALVDTMLDYDSARRHPKDEKCAERYEKSYKKLVKLHCEAVFFEWLKDKEESQMDILGLLAEKKCYGIYLSINGDSMFLSSAGFTPTVIHMPTDNDLVSDISHMADGLDKDIGKFKFSVHGYLPIQRVLGFNTEQLLYTYQEGHKIDINCWVDGTGRLGLYNLDTMSIDKVFYTHESIKDSCNVRFNDMEIKYRDMISA